MCHVHAVRQQKQQPNCIVLFGHLFADETAEAAVAAPVGAAIGEAAAAVAATVADVSLQLQVVSWAGPRWSRLGDGLASSWPSSEGCVPSHRFVGPFCRAAPGLPISQRQAHIRQPPLTESLERFSPFATATAAAAAASAFKRGNTLATVCSVAARIATTRCFHKRYDVCSG